MKELTNDGWIWDSLDEAEARIALLESERDDLLERVCRMEEELRKLKGAKNG